MKHLSIPRKIILTSVIPIMALSCFMMWSISSTFSHITEETTQLIIHAEHDSVKSKVKSHTDIAYSTIAPIYESAGANDEEAKQRVKEILRRMAFDNNNYIFVYSYEGVNLVTRPKPNLEGKNFYDVKDKNGKPVVQETIDIAKSGEGFYDYTWLNPATDKDELKISYIKGLNKWGWYIGSGAYMNQVNQKINHAQQTISEKSIEGIKAEALIVLCVTLISLSISFLLARYISTPIKQLVKHIEVISAGDLTPRVTKYSNDEIGVFTDKFNHFLDKIHVVLSDVANNARQVSFSASELNQMSSDTYNAITQQDSEIVSIAKSVEHMSSSSEGIADNGNTVKLEASDARAKTQEGTKAVRQNLASMQELAGDIDSASQSICAVEKRTEEITSMLEVIQSVTEQTNLLALNAAIEAARAGEQGRGFAVVADEVRSLAMRSADSAQEIRQIIDGLIADTEIAVKSMGVSKERSEKNLMQTTVASESLQAIELSISSILDTSAVIANTTGEQSALTREISQNTHRITELSRSNAEGTRHTSEACATLDTLSQQLLKNINYFTLKS